MLTPSIREDLQLFEGTPLEDGSPTWLLFDTLTNKYFTIGLNAFRLLNYWNADVDTKTFIKNVEQKGVNLKEEELNLLNLISQNPGYRQFAAGISVPNLKEKKDEKAT